jgi:predicted metal-dependent HD superfamily phosphohydrolase
MEYATSARFRELSHRLGLSDHISQHAYATLVHHYGEDHRKYHNLVHIDRMLGWMDAVGERNDAMEWAIWYHDAIYDPLGADNEERSARFFRECLAAWIPASLADEIERLILATDLKRSRSGRDDENLMIDIDLSILGSAPEDYAAYRTAIRSEYAVVPADRFLSGRRAILVHFLSRQIYHTPPFLKLEIQARLNMREEIAALDAAMQAHS